MTRVVVRLFGLEVISVGPEWDTEEYDTLTEAYPHTMTCPACHTLISMADEETPSDDGVA